MPHIFALMHRGVAEILQIKEAVLDDATMRDRLLVCRNPDEADRDRIVREQIIERLETAIAA